MADVIIFGVLDTAELAHFYLENDSEHNVVAFAVNREYITENSFKGLPVVAFEEIEQVFPLPIFLFLRP